MTDRVKQLLWKYCQIKFKFNLTHPRRVISSLIFEIFSLLGEPRRAFYNRLETGIDFIQRRHCTTIYQPCLYFMIY